MQDDGRSESSVSHDRKSCKQTEEENKSQNIHDDSKRSDSSSSHDRNPCKRIAEENENVRDCKQRSDSLLNDPSSYSGNSIPEEPHYGMLNTNSLSLLPAFKDRVKKWLHSLEGETSEWVVYGDVSDVICLLYIKGDTGQHKTVGTIYSKYNQVCVLVNKVLF